MQHEIFQLIPDIEPDEMATLQANLRGYSEEQTRNFVMAYRARRVAPQQILLTALLGLVVVAGVHRFMLKQIGMGIAYVLTAGFCLIGTIIDLVNYKKLATDHNIEEMRKMIQMGMY